MELIQRSFGAESFDFDEPQFFSLTMDHELARINVHWISAPTDGGQYSFHVKGLSKHLLDVANGLRAAVRAIKNILDYGSDARLRTLCKALDAYRKTVIAEREAMTRQRDQRYKAKSQPEQRRRSRRDQQSSYEQQQYQSPGDQQPLYGEQEYQSTGDQQPLYGEQEYQSTGDQQPLYDQQEYLSPGAWEHNRTRSCFKIASPLAPLTATLLPVARPRRAESPCCASTQRMGLVGVNQELSTSLSFFIIRFVGLWN
jgi:hypothetical protein